ncbi:MAG TPA: STAS domain-containing protein [Polyangiaceae bacterium]|nr:STAS domain-containing protein [Polyangiaceae bacterium]
MSYDEAAYYADVAASVVRLRGEVPRAKVIAMLLALDLSPDQGAEVLAYGLANGLFTADPAGTLLRAKAVAPAEADASSRQGARSETEVEAALYRAIRDNVPASVWAVDRRGVLIHHAGKGLEAAGVEQGQFLGKSVFDLYAGSAGNEAVRQALEGRPAHSFDEQHAVFWETWYIPIRDERGAVAMVAGITLDVSAAKRAENELRAKLALIESQQRVINALSTPIIEVWDKVLTLPMLGVIDSARAAAMMASLLERINGTGARVAILDLTGIHEIDTATAAHVLKLIQAIRLLGAEGIITGIQPRVAQTMVALGLDLGSIVTRASLREGLRFCMTRMRDGAGAPA